MVTDCKIQLVDMLEQILEKIADGKTQTLSATDEGESLSFPLKNSSEVGLEVASPPLPAGRKASRTALPAAKIQYRIILFLVSAFRGI